MKKFLKQDQDALLDVLKRHEEELKSYPGVHYVDVGYMFVKGKPTDELAIRVHVSEKKPESQLEASQILPVNIEGFPVDVIQSNPTLEDVDRDARFNPLLGGVAVKNTRHPFFGTLGAIIFDSTSSVAMGLSNHHVLVGTGGRIGDDIAQPNSVAPADIIGTLARWNLDLDCAVCTLNTSRTITHDIVDFPGGARGALEAVVGLRVSKSGRTTGTTFGIVDGVSTREFSIIPDPTRPAAGGEISAPGDSGSLWLLAGTVYAVGLHFAGELDPNPAAERAFAKKIVNVANALNIGFVPPLLSTLFKPGEYTIQQKSNNRFVDAHESASRDFAIVTRTVQNNDTQRWLITPVGVVCTIQQMSNNRFVDAYQTAANDYGVVTRTAEGNDTQKWIFEHLEGNTYTIQQMSSRRFMDAHDPDAGRDFALVTRPAQDDNTQKWILRVPRAGERNVFTIQHKATSRFMDAHETAARDFALVTRTAQNNDTQRWCLTPVAVECTIQQVSSGRFMDAHDPDAGRDYALVTRTAQNNDTQRWILTPRAPDIFTIQHKATGRYMDAHEIAEKDFALVTRTAQDNDTQRWIVKSA